MQNSTEEVQTIPKEPDLNDPTRGFIGQTFRKRLQTIINNVTKLLSDEKAYKAMANAVNPYGDGKACQRISQIIRNKYPCAI